MTVTCRRDTVAAHASGLRQLRFLPLILSLKRGCTDVPSRPRRRRGSQGRGIKKGRILSLLSGEDSSRDETLQQRGIVHEKRKEEEPAQKRGSDVEG